jgi:hypothetical protein
MRPSERWSRARRCATADHAIRAVSYTLTLALPRDVAERLTARAIREGRNIEAVVTEMLEAEARRRG